jgi:hypothetical protein
MTAPAAGQHGNVSLPTRNALYIRPALARARPGSERAAASALLVGVEAGLGDPPALLGRDVDIGG